MPTEPGRGDADQASGCIKIARNERSLICTNECKEPVLLSVFTNSNTDVETFMMKFNERKTLTEDVTHLTENTNIPNVVQKPAF